MDYLVKNYLRACEIEFSCYGFKRKNKAFVRVVNDVMQNFAIEKISSGRECRVNFAVIPLCLRIEKDYIIGGVYSRELRIFDPPKALTFVYNPNDEWYFDPKLEESMDKCIEEVIRKINKNLIPFFSKADSSKTAYEEFCELDRMEYNRYVNVKREEDKQFYKEGVLMIDNVKYYMALKNGDYDVAVAHLKAFEQQNLYSYKSMDERGYLTEEDRLRREKSIADLRKEITLIASHDESIINRIISENEAYSLDNLKGIL